MSVPHAHAHAHASDHHRVSDQSRRRGRRLCRLGMLRLWKRISLGGDNTI
jgi:hypothetical protein